MSPMTVISEALNIIFNNQDLFDKILDAVKSGELKIEGLGPCIKCHVATWAPYWMDWESYKGWLVQKNMITQHCRIVGPDSIRYAWGSEDAILDLFQKLVDRATTATIAIAGKSVLEKAIEIIVNNPSLLKRYSNINIPMEVMDMQIAWNVLAQYKGWKIEEHKKTHQWRVLDPKNVRRGWGTNLNVFYALADNEK